MKYNKMGKNGIYQTEKSEFIKSKNRINENLTATFCTNSHIPLTIICVYILMSYFFQITLNMSEEFNVFH